MKTYKEISPKSREKDRLLTNAEAAEMLRISVRHWRRVRSLACLEAVIVGRRPRYWHSQVVAAVDAGRVTYPDAIVQSPKARACASAETSGS